MNTENFYTTPLGQWVRKTVLRFLQSCQLKKGYDVRTLLVGAPHAYVSAIAEHVLGPVTLAYNESETEPPELPHLLRVETAMISHNTLPFGDFMFDQVILLHALEFSPSPPRLMREVQRVLASDGRAVVVASNRTGIWSWFQSTPFGVGITLSQSQLHTMVRGADLSPLRVGSLLFFPPVQMDFAPLHALADGLEKIGQYLSLGIGGAVVGVAIKQRYAGTGHLKKSPTPKKVKLNWASARGTHTQDKHVS